MIRLYSATALVPKGHRGSRGRSPRCQGTGVTISKELRGSQSAKHSEQDHEIQGDRSGSHLQPGINLVQILQGTRFWYQPKPFASEATAAFLHRFVALLPQKRPSLVSRDSELASILRSLIKLSPPSTTIVHRPSLVLSFRRHASGFTGSGTKSRAFCLSNSRGLYASLIGTEWPRVHPNPASPALHVFFVFFVSRPRRRVSGDITEPVQFSEKINQILGRREG
jgi:hypothetical protein